ncbi:hypothetical protein V493_05399 [Pseudogymnoascus sp. VKM F-4281 (FW-2241)]|nr:hypothetical protein V493_05399 [Pseudogymnoascus sp. VKM F-4281 (FW-2241)]
MREAFTGLPALVTRLARTAPQVVENAINARGNPLNIDWDPAPSPEDGPPLSAGALRDKAFLPAEIGGIVGAYVFVVAVLLLGLFFAGRRLRKAAELARHNDVEMLGGHMINPAAYYPSPISPTTPTSTFRHAPWPAVEKIQNPYVFPSQNCSPISPGSNPGVDSRIIEADRELLNRGLEDIYAHVMEQEEAKAAGLNVADMPAPTPLPSVSPQRQSTASSKRLEKIKPADLSSTEKTHSRTSSLISSLKSPRRKGIRGMKISSPMATPISTTFPATYASDEEPLSPRRYQPPPPPPPPVPEGQLPYHYHSRNNSSVQTTDPSPISPARSIAENLASAPMGPPPNNRSVATHRPLNLAIPGATAVNPPSASSSATRQLPFRAFDPPPGLSSPSFSHSTKTTVLERTTPLSPGIKTPWSAGAAPYSPYQPFTPLVPITPRLITREDRKAMKKMEPKSPVIEMVKDKDDLWDSGY